MTLASKKNKSSPADKEKKTKLVRDSFTIPKTEYAAIDSLKARALTLGVAIKKSELLRAGLMLLDGLNDAKLKSALAAVPTLKTGRPSAKPEAVNAESASPTAGAAPAEPEAAESGEAAAKTAPAARKTRKTRKLRAAAAAQPASGAE